MSTYIQITSPLVVKQFTLDLSQVAGTYDIFTAFVSDVIIEHIILYIATAGAVLSSVAIKTNQTTAFDILTAVDGAVANLTSQKNLITTWTQQIPIILASGQKMQYFLVGVTGSGSIRMSVMYRSFNGSYIQ